MAKARTTFLTQLDSTAVLLPGDEWIAAQRIRYLTEVGKHEDALSRLAECQTTRWWCLALTGFVLHDSGDFALADETFTTALASMPDSVRCRWTDLSEILDADVERVYRKLGCEERSELASRIWWLADPLVLVPGNERRTEHFARRVYDRMHRETTSTFGLRWGKDNTEIVMRFGWPIRWERTQASRTSVDAGPSVIGQERQGAFRFLPTLADLEGPTTNLVPGSWPLRKERPQARYAPAYAREFVPLDHQLATFRRGDSVVVVAAYTPPSLEDSSGRERPYFGEALLRLGPGHPTTSIVARGRAGRPLAVKAPRQGSFVTLETLSRRDSVAGREQYWLDFTNHIPTGFGISDILFIEPVFVLPQSLSQAIPMARPGLIARPSETVGVYWEFYDLESVHGLVEVSLTVERMDKAWLRKAGEFLGVVGRAKERIVMRWRDAEGSVGGIAGRSITLELPESEGRYHVRIETRTPGRTVARTTSELLIQEEDGR